MTCITFPSSRSAREHARPWTLLACSYLPTCISISPIPFVHILCRIYRRLVHLLLVYILAPLSYTCRINLSCSARPFCTTQTLISPCCSCPGDYRAL
ncbi:hypothetical protein B0H21DRAFT_315589 [Amylocystis lapponica]|nr:hypothetical protein B0H21DRAFT_315589 [Amylocystis lapponica]